MSKLDAVNNLRIRRVVLELLLSEYPGTLDLRALQFALDNLGYPMPEEHLSAHLKYLDGKGLLEITQRKGYGFSIEFASLTPRGWDFIDGLLKESGVDREI